MPDLSRRALLLTRPLLALMAAATVGCGAAFATYPERPVTIVVPFAPGGANDVVVRITWGTADIPSEPPRDLRPLHALVLDLRHAPERAPVIPAGSTAQPRAPPAR